MIQTLRKKLDKKGFTLAELLIVIAIIAILVAIAVPLFTTQLEKARVATDEANYRSAKGAMLALVDETDSFEKYYRSDGEWTTTVGDNTVKAQGTVKKGSGTTLNPEHDKGDVLKFTYKADATTDAEKYTLAWVKPK